MYCEQCGKRIAETAKFCPYCGNAVGIADSVQSQQSVKQEISTPPSLETKQGSIPASLETRQEYTPASPETRQEQKYVGFWARFAANFLDGILISIFVSPASIRIIYLLSKGKIRSDWISESACVAIAFYSVLYILSQVILLVLWYKKQASIGKMAISAKIVDARTGKASTKNQLIGRYFAYLLSFLPLGLGFLWIAFDSKKQGWHDKLAGTAVIYV
ncbi:MAG: RDD family protein [Fibrobacter sp.]|uniref:RDD family protein n=1 Tax=uncultured Fibrobacter sp. TaxID=261512 RepID=UPI0025DD2767|nr:RDD family protein [uncultured Fibrobacter sp.]MBR2469342.1 RDD family protein [Fibrobacter sp.]